MPSEQHAPGLAFADCRNGHFRLVLPENLNWRALSQSFRNVFQRRPMTPLFEMEWHFCFEALLLNLDRPSRIHRSRVRAGLTSCYHPVNAVAQSVRQ
ncbi:hypothetical protein P3T17_007167 [Paraburkholderia sp. GAS82]